MKKKNEKGRGKRKRKKNLSKQIIGNAGLYYTCYKLSLHGWNVMPTARNTRGIDIVAYNSKDKCYLGIQVKTLSKKVAVPLGESTRNLMGDFWVIISQVISKPTAFILTPDEIKQRAHRREKDGRISYWLQPRKYATEDFCEKWERIK